MAHAWPVAEALEESDILAFRGAIYEKADALGRSFPWRENPSPYKVLVSEFMLQQTQTARVAPYFESFLRSFPTLEALASATLADVLRVWAGLGYNRRAKYLWAAAQKIRESGAPIPSEPDELCRLPGVGSYTAGAIAAFAYNKPVCFVDTNIRRVYIHYFFDSGTRDIPDGEILRYVEVTLDRAQASRWYNALMDVGSELGKLLAENPNLRSDRYRKQAAFEGSVRQARGAIVRCLLREEAHTIETLSEVVDRSPEELEMLIATLEKEGLLVREERRVYLA